jgi:hypothetical protein
MYTDLDRLRQIFPVGSTVRHIKSREEYTVESHDTRPMFGPMGVVIGRSLETSRQSALAHNRIERSTWIGVEESEEEESLTDEELAELGRYIEENTEVELDPTTNRLVRNVPDVGELITAWRRARQEAW